VTGATPIEFRLLGPLEAGPPGTTVPLGGAKQRALLAILLLHANEVVSSDRLTDGVWGEQPPATAATALQVYVSRLRKLLGPELLVTQPPGYALRVDPEQLDVARFERLLARAREARSRDQTDEAASLLRSALDLWRGPALGDLYFEPFAQAEIGRLEELRLAALEERIDADLALGRHAELIGELEALAAENPLRERLRGQLMLALYRSGRQAEALEAYQAGRRVLVEELGIEPSAELQRLERAILTQDAALGAEERSGVATVLFLDLGVLGEIEAVGDRAFNVAAGELGRAGARVERGLADAALATFEDAPAALRAALAVRERLRTDVGDSVAPRIGLATAEVHRGERTSGPAVVLAARRVRSARPGEILVGERTAAAAGSGFELRRRGDAYVLVG
jgi:DNA-binding SARP family transcriptional activator